MRSIWKGAIGFGLVNIPIKLYSGVQNSNLDLTMLDEKDHEKIRYQRVNEKSHKEVGYDQIVRGYKLNDKWVVLDEHDFEEAAPEKTRVIELENFVELSAINPIFYETSYYAEPEAQGKKAYALLLQSLVKSKKAGVARFVFRKTENLCVIHPLDGVIVITKIRFQEEVRDTAEVKVPEVKISKKELDMGMALIKQYTDKFDISEFKDEYSRELMKIIRAKAKGKRATVKKMKPKKEVSDDLYDQLMQSLGSKKQA
ncbi:Ku protein [Pedobacter yulinensis]|uniref:Non-homologous end joining protein Ku n=1 Tax=Pedobacter yulinensis TaxID=2126353 RepID=A0A2T3HHJ4_9SPHI|nr:Ku protein [Pedobacter yulinensis]PST81907.1 Ku protein [Pedobacter yulinensis]